MKKFLAGAMALVMMFSFAACSSGEDTQQSNNNENNVESYADNPTILIGGIGPLTGGAASYGTSVKQGAEIAIAEINEAGGIKAGDGVYTFALDFQDDESSEDKAITAYNSLMDKGMKALIGTVTSAPCIAVKELSKQDNILQITPSGSAIECITDAPNVFRLCFTDPLQGRTMADFVKDQGFTKAAVIFNNSDDYSTGMKNAFVEQVKTNGGEVVTEEAFNEGDVDFSTQLTKIKSTDAEIIFCPVYYEAAAYITQQAKELGMNLPFIGGDGWDGILAQVTDSATIEGAVFLSPFLATDEAEEVAGFVAKYQQKYSSTPDQFAADGYDTVYVIKAAIEKANSIESEDMIAAMTEITVDGITGSMSFTEDGEPDKSAKFVVIKDGQYTAME
ncbi:ABC transporter substrate-binding protein [Clostridium sp. MD294]|uniref:ABC transporter substrate-binding protein n=1 Tax=Clostridium sp. MD294 TaxID=97138 RepID=UPI0002CAC945|nr:ABC transporter substrate-binding protein [Clostridium sp. MD294]NDO45548.1 ABC transporter substrate-binding protein [Clostridium sp. MD294]USF30798.1 Leu/Ile/Val-binding protein [Clostridium sp. MD294]